MLHNEQQRVVPTGTAIKRSCILALPQRPVSAHAKLYVFHKLMKCDGITKDYSPLLQKLALKPAFGLPGKSLTW